MELRHLRYFVAVAEAGSITRAAHAVRIAQPSLSRQLRQLEQDVGEPLFDRGGRRARLTPAGEVLLPLARDLVGRADRAAALLHGLAAPDRVTLRLVAPETTVADVIAPFLAALPRDAPMIDVREALPARVHEEVLGGTADVGVTSVPPPRTIASRLLVLGSDHGARRQLDAAMSDAGLAYGVAAETNVPQVALALAAAGRGVAVASDDSRYGLHGLRIRPAGGPLELRVPLFAAWEPSHYAESVIGDLVADLTRYAEERYQPEPGHPRRTGLVSPG